MLGGGGSDNQDFPEDGLFSESGDGGAGTRRNLKRAAKTEGR